jgi:hypothetical protein
VCWGFLIVRAGRGRLGLVCFCMFGTGARDASVLLAWSGDVVGPGMCAWMDEIRTEVFGSASAAWVGPGGGARMDEIRTEVFGSASARCVGCKVGRALRLGGRGCLNLGIK